MITQFQDTRATVYAIRNALKEAETMRLFLIKETTTLEPVKIKEDDKKDLAPPIQSFPKLSGN